MIAALLTVSQARHSVRSPLFYLKCTKDCSQLGSWLEGLTLVAVAGILS